MTSYPINKTLPSVGGRVFLLSAIQLPLMYNPLMYNLRYWRIHDINSLNEGFLPCIKIPTR